MNLRDLVKKFFEGRAPGLWSESDKDIKGMRAVVEALRDEMCACQADDERSPITLDTHQLWQEFQAILGDGPPAYPLHAECAPSDRGQVAGGSTREDEKAVEAVGDKGPVSVNSPATDPIRDAVAMARGRVLVVDDIPMLNKLAAMMSPATDPAPAVCEFRGRPGRYIRSCNGARSIYNKPFPPEACAFCKKPVKFTEAK